MCRSETLRLAMVAGDGRSRFTNALTVVVMTSVHKLRDTLGSSLRHNSDSCTRNPQCMHGVSQQRQGNGVGRHADLPIKNSFDTWKARLANSPTSSSGMPYEENSSAGMRSR